MDGKNWQTWVAIYAALIATGALFLEIRRWFDSRPRLALSVSKNMSTYGSLERDTRTFLILNVSNRGGVPVTITNMAVFSYKNFFQRIRDKPFKAAVMLIPSLNGSQDIPFYLESGKHWIGAGAYDETLREFVESGTFYVGIYATSREKPYVKKVNLSIDEFDSALKQ